MKQGARARLRLISLAVAGRRRTAVTATRVPPLTPRISHARAGGAHFAFLDGFLKRNNGGSGFVVGSKLSIADIQLFDLMDIFLRDPLFPKQLKQRACPAPPHAAFGRSAGRLLDVVPVVLLTRSPLVLSVIAQTTLRSLRTTSASRPCRRSQSTWCAMRRTVPPFPTETGIVTPA